MPERDDEFMVPLAWVLRILRDEYGEDTPTGSYLAAVIEERARHLPRQER